MTQKHKIVSVGIFIVPILCLTLFYYFRLNGQKLPLYFKVSSFNPLTKEAVTLSTNKKQILLQLSSQVQNSLNLLQNPSNFSQTRKYVCRIHTPCGLGCTIHHIGPCFYNAVGMNRTLIVELMKFEYGTGKGMQDVYEAFSNRNSMAEYDQPQVDVSDKTASSAEVVIHHVHGNYKPFTPWGPFTIPDVLLPALWGIHKQPEMWWMGQIHTYITRLNAETNEGLNELKAKLRFDHPIVGQHFIVHVRRTDKLIWEAKKFELSQYMEHVEAWYNNYQNKTKHGNVTKRVFLSTDEPTVLQEAINNHPKYQFLAATNHIAKAGRNHRDSLDGLRAIAFDIELLSSCDFLVCTFSSNVGRLAYELMFSKQFDDVEATSLDTEYHYGGFSRHLVSVKTHKKTEDNGVEMRIGDVIYPNLTICNGERKKSPSNSIRECPWPVKYDGLDWKNVSCDHANQSTTCLSWVSGCGNGCMVSLQ